MKRLALALVLFVACSSGAAAQGCQQCKAGVETASENTQRAMRRGILVLMVPSVLIVAGLYVLAYRNRH